MNPIKSAAILLAAQLCICSLANAKEQFNQTAQSPSILPGQAAPEKGTLAVDEWYAITQTTLIYPVKEENSGARMTGPITLEPGVKFNVLARGENGVVQIGIDEDISQANPQLAKMRKDVLVFNVNNAELLRGSPKWVDASIELDYPTAFMEDGMDFYSTAVASRRGGRAHRGGGGPMCLRDVRLTAARFTKHVPQNIPFAAKAYPHYRAAGWSPIAYGSSDPVGTACFFTGGPKGYGHAAIKIGPNRWKGAGVRPTPFINGRNLVGCLTPPSA